MLTLLTGMDLLLRSGGPGWGVGCLLSGAKDWASCSARNGSSNHLLLLKMQSKNQHGVRGTEQSLLVSKFTDMSHRLGRENTHVVQLKKKNVHACIYIFCRIFFLNNLICMKCILLYHRSFQPPVLFKLTEGADYVVWVI